MVVYVSNHVSPPEPVEGLAGKLTFRVVLVPNRFHGPSNDDADINCHKSKSRGDVNQPTPDVKLCKVGIKPGNYNIV